MGQISQSTVS